MEDNSKEASRRSRTHMSKEMVTLMLNNMIKELKTVEDNAVEDSSALSDFQKNAEQYSDSIANTILQIKDVPKERSSFAFINSRNAGNLVIKAEPIEENFEIENNPLEILRHTSMISTKLQSEVIEQTKSLRVVISNIFDHSHCMISGSAATPVAGIKQEFEIVLKKSFKILENIKLEHSYCMVSSIASDKPSVKTDNSPIVSEIEEPEVISGHLEIKSEEMDLKDLNPLEILRNTCMNSIKLESEVIEQTKSLKIVESNIFGPSHCMISGSAATSIAGMKQELEILPMKSFKILENIKLEHSYCMVSSIASDNPTVSEIEEPPEVISGHLEIKSEEIDLKEEDLLENEIRSEEFSSKQLLISVKSDNSLTVSKVEEPHEVISCHWEVKSEEIDLKEEDLLENEIRVSSARCMEEKVDDYEKPKFNVCELQTKWKHSFKGHLLRHKNPEDVNLFKCDKCEYRTHIKGNLKRHLFKHKNLRKLDLFACDKCEYRTHIERYLKSHFFIHKNPKKVDLFACDKCKYRTNIKRSLSRHLFIHKIPEKLDLFSCDNCEYRTHVKRYLKSHVLGHINPENVNLFKCGKCEYRTHVKNYLRKHILRHINPEKADLFKCDMCEYDTHVKENLRHHIKRHNPKKPKEVEILRCGKCEYQTPNKHYLKVHSLRHKNFRVP